MGRIPQEIIDQILDGTDIVETIGGYIQVKKAGRNFKGNCPFHNEKTPSFVVSPDKQIYHCFGCGAGGNVINFVMKHENMEFPEAVELLASKAGVELPKFQRESSEEVTLANRIYKVNDFAATFYQNSLKDAKGKAALSYLKERGIEEETIKEFKIGYAPDGWENFKKLCDSKKVPADLPKKAGLTVASEKGRGDYDRFRKRIIFPVFNERGNIVAFGARVLDDSLPKYINSPETVVYSKSNVLYGLNLTKRSIREKGYALIVEGYMDVIVPFQFGVTNTVAASGTALTPRQVSMLKKYTDTAVMVFDSDQAGETASLRGLDIIIANGMKVKIATLPEGEDPDSFLRKYGKEKFENALNEAQDLYDYKLTLLVKKLGIKDIGGIADEMLPTIAKIENAVVQSSYLRRLAERLGVHESSLRYEMGKVKPDYSYHYEAEEKVDRESTNYRSSEVHLLGLAILNGRAFARIKDELGLEKFCDTNVKKALSVVEELYKSGESVISPSKLISRFEEEPLAKEAVMQAIAKMDITKDAEKALDDCIFCVKKEIREDTLKTLTMELKEAESLNNDERIRKILNRINKIHKEKVA